MKANEPKRKIFTDAIDLIGGGDTAVASTVNAVEMLDIDVIRPFRDHPFHLYEGERLDDMVESIKEHGILNPVIVRKMHFGYEMLSGHNRQNAGKLAGLKEIPAIVKENLPDAEAYVYVIETNLMQRSFATPLLPYKQFLTCWEGSYGNEYHSTYLLTPYLATINNLSSAVVKNADKTMKITYTLTEEES